MKFNVEVIEKETEEVIESLYQVEYKVARAVANGYAYDPFYTVRISNQNVSGYYYNKTKKGKLMNIKQKKSYSLLEVGTTVAITNPYSHARHMKYTTTGTIAKLKGLNGSMVEIVFDNGRKAYYNWSSTVEVV